jgi:hypothetical protein
MTRPVSLFPPAPHSRYRAYTWGSLLACWLDFSQVGLVSESERILLPSCR